MNKSMQMGVISAWFHKKKLLRCINKGSEIKVLRYQETPEISLHLIPEGFTQIF